MSSRREERFIYQIEVRGQVDSEDLIAMSPLQIRLVQKAEKSDADGTTRFTICTDQSGFIGMLRHLHARGLVLLSTQRML